MASCPYEAVISSAVKLGIIDNEHTEDDDDDDEESGSEESGSGEDEEEDARVGGSRSSEGIDDGIKMG